MKKPIVLKVLSWIILVPVGLTMIVFSVVNRHPVQLDFWPFAWAPEVRLFLVVLGVLIVGVVWGGVAGWLAAGPARRRAREANRRADEAAAENRRLKDRISRLEAESREASATAGHPALPPADAA